jgi:hypothetical protein
MSEQTVENHASGPDSSADTTPDFAADWRPGPAFAAWLLPGLGHVLIGQPRRGLIIAAGVLGLWLAGLLIGGISVIDHKPMGDGMRQRFSLWFVGQAMLSPSVAVNIAHQHLKEVSVVRLGGTPQPEHQPRPIFTPALGRVAEIGTLYTALAGLLNLLAILDAGWGPPRHGPRLGRPPVGRPRQDRSTMQESDTP